VKEDSATGVQTNDHLCAFGKWYFSEGPDALRKQTSLPSRTNIRSLEEPHRLLHESAMELNGMMAAGNFVLARNYYSEASSKY
jgi:hypothetical protein